MAQQLRFERYTLPNGLTVILHEDRSLPLAVVNLWYGVGSKDEVEGRSGFAHLFEHLMFMGTERVPGAQFDQIMEAGGGANNASTSEDRTNYYASGPSNLLPTLLWLEADRLEALGQSMTQDKLDRQRDVVRNERRQSYENRPYGKAWLLLPEILYPKGHPYAHSVIGSHEDLEAATVKDVQEFFATFYTPGNASLVVAGDFDPGAIKPLIARLFGSLKAGEPPPHRGAAPVRLPGVIRRTVEDDVPAARTIMAWLSPPHFDSGDAEMDLVAGILADGASSRLEQALIHQRQLAQDVAARQDSASLGSVFYVQATALPGVSLDTLEAAIEEEVARFTKGGPALEEVQRVVNKEEAAFARGLQELQHRADLLNMYQSILGDPGRIEWDLDRYRRATPEALQSWAVKVLDPGHRLIMRIVPEGTLQPVAAENARDEAPEMGAPPAWAPPVPRAFRMGGSGGMEVWHLESHRAPLVSLEWVIPLAAAADPPAQAGLTSLLTELMMEGAGDRDAKALAEAIDILGSEIHIAAGRTSATVLVNSLTRNLAATLDLVQEILLRPRLLETDFKRVKELRLAELEQRAVNPGLVAAVVSHRRLREAQGVPGFPIAGYANTVQPITLQQVRARHQDLMAALPNAKVVIVGDVDEATLRKELGERFPAGATTPGPMFSFQPKPLADELKVYVADRPDAPQTVIRFHRNADVLSSPRTPSLWLANTIFGGSFTSRLNLNLRENHGFTYGARSSVMQSELEGSMIASSSVKTEVTGRAIEEFLREYERLAKGDFTADELEKARATQKTDIVKEFESTGDSVRTLARLAEAGLPPDFLVKLFRALDAVTVKDIASAGVATMLPKPGVLVLVGDQSKILPQLEKLDLPKPILVDPDGNPQDQ